MNKRIYMDNAATTRITDTVFEYMLPYLKNEYGNPSALYDMGADNKKVLLDARKNIAAVMQCNPQNIFFTSGGTESDNWALIGVAESHASKGKHIITTQIEHHAILNTCHYLEKHGFEITYLGVNEQGYISLDELKRQLRSDTILVSIMMANNEIGTIQPIREIGKILKGHSALFHTDAVQAFGQLPINPAEMHIDLLSASSHKFHGPKGAGFLYIRDGLILPPFMHGGSQERGVRAGTENVPAIAGMGKAAEAIVPTREETNHHLQQLRDYMIHRIETEIPYCHLNGPRENRLPGNVNISFQFVDGETIVILLDMDGICASSGSACTAGQAKASHVIQAIGLPDDYAKGTIRFTLGNDLTVNDVDYTVEHLKQILANNRKMNPEYETFIRMNEKR